MVRVPDDAMRPAFRAGDFAYVDPDVPVAPGAFVCVRLDRATTTVRLYAEERGRRLLRTLEPDRVERAVDADDGTTIRGVVVSGPRVHRRPAAARQSDGNSSSLLSRTAAVGCRRGRGCGAAGGKRSDWVVRNPRIRPMLAIGRC